MARMTRFTVHGPFKIERHEGKGGSRIDDDKVPDFWSKHSQYAGQRGCYVFGLRSRGLIPWYVGLARKSFNPEAFTGDKLNKYGKALIDCAKGTPVIFFVCLPTRKGAPNVKAMEELEKDLIQYGVQRNPNLMNKKGTKLVSWGIAGVLRGGKGKRSKAAREFRASMGIAED